MIMKRQVLRRVTIIALLSRIGIILFQFVFNTIFSDHRSDGFISPAVNISKNAYDDYIFWTLGGLFRWDAQYFLHITIYGYVYENSLAFFPGFPLCVRSANGVLTRLCKCLNILSISLISSTVLNIIIFVLTARTLFHLSCKTLKDETLATFAVILFSVNPASIFFSAPYSETLFSFLSFQVMTNENPFISSAFVTLSSAVRSNGVVNVGFPIYRELKKFVNQSPNHRSYFKLFCKLCCILICSLCSFIVYQIYSYKSFCTLYSFPFQDDVRKVAYDRGYILRGENVTDICQAWLPYFYVQKHYWNVGFLHYFSFKQLPNFVLALPMILFSTVHCLKYFYRNFHQFSTLGLKRSSDFVATRLFVYNVHLFFLIVMCFFFVHIQVSTRLLCSSSPLVYWYGAMTLKLHKNNSHRTELLGFSWTIRLIKLYIFFYFFIGTALFSNFYPWT